MKIELEHYEDKQIEVSLKNGLKIFYNQTQKQIKLYNESEEDEKFLDFHEDNIIYLQHIVDNHFASISLDKTIKFWNFNGELIGTFSLESLPYYVFTVQEDLLIICKEKSYLIDKKANVKYEIQEKVASYQSIELQQYDKQLHILGDNYLSIYDIKDGREIIKFKGLIEFISKAKVLNSKDILLLPRGSSDTQISLWSSNGDWIKKFNFSFDFNDIIETEDNKLIVLCEDKSIKILNEKCEVESFFKKDTMCDSFKALLDSIAKYKKSKILESSIDVFPHITNPKSNQSFPIEELPNQNSSKFDKQIWDFFNRPIFDSIFKLLKKEENLSKKFKRLIKENQDATNQEIEESEKKLKTATLFRNMIVGVMAVMFGILAFIISTNSSDQKLVTIFMGSIAVLIYLFFISYMKMSSIKTELQDSKSGLATFDRILLELENFIFNIRSYRYSIFKQIPVVNDSSLYNGIQIEEKIENLLHGKILNEALNECGILEEDIISSDKKPIVLHDWSLIQSNSKKVNEHNMNSYWGIDGKILFATQFIQYIFLTKDKIDVFNTHYDFIQNKFIHKEAHAFYYKDVTNITKKEVDREILTLGKKEVPATEITLKVSSGDSINLTILNEDTFNILNSHFDIQNNNEQKDDSDKLAKILERKEQIKNSDTLNDEEKQEELEMLDIQISTLKSNKIITGMDISKTDKIDMTIKNIRSQIKVHK